MLQILYTLRKDQMTAMRNKDQNAKIAINLLLARLISANKDMLVKQNRELTDEEVIDQVKSELKQTRDSLLEAQKANRNDQIVENEKKIEVILTYLPRQLNETEVIQVIKVTALENGLELITKNKGQIIKAVMANYGKNVEGKTVSSILGTLLV